LTFGSLDLSNKTVVNQTLFNKAIKYIQTDELIHFDGVKVIEYRWAVIFTPDDTLKTTIAKIEVDLPYISIPALVFSQVKESFNNNFGETERNCTERMCSLLLPCSDAIKLF